MHWRCKTDSLCNLACKSREFGFCIGNLWVVARVHLTLELADSDSQTLSLRCKAMKVLNSTYFIFLLRNERSIYFSQLCNDAILDSRRD